MTDDQLLLANAYVDDDVDADERARAEADDEVMAEVARLRSAISALRDVEPPDGDRRDAAIAAALRTSGRPLPVAPPVPLRPRGRWWAAAGIAAAVVAIAIAGVVVLRAVPGGDDDDAAIELSARTDSAAEAQPAAGADAPTGGGSTIAASATTAGGAATTEHAADAQAAIPTTTAAGPFPTTTPPPAAAVPAVVLATAADVAAFADAARREDKAPPGSPRCSGGEYVGSALYGGVSPAVAVEVFIDGRDGVARDLASCVEVARARLP